MFGDADLHGEIVTSAIEGRMADDEVSVFDSTGLAIQDVATAHDVYERTCEDDRAGSDLPGPD